jgi:hypothetical protein
MVYLQEASRFTLPPTGHEVMVGAVASFNVIVNEQEAALPAASVAVSVMSCVVL